MKRYMRETNLPPQSVDEPWNRLESSQDAVDRCGKIDDVDSNQKATKMKFE